MWPLSGMAIDQWSVQRSKTLAKRQYGLLCAAILAAKAGGRVVYSTCSLSPFENDEVIARLLERKADQVEVQITPSAMGEATRFGHQIRPDRHQGWGPMYWCVLKVKPTVTSDN